MPAFTLVYFLDTHLLCGLHVHHRFNQKEGWKIINSTYNVTES